MPDENDTVIPVLAEELEVGVEKVKTGSVRVHKTVHEHEETIDEPVHRERVDVRRVVKNEIVAGPMPTRQEGDTTIIPVVEEVVTVEKHWVLKEEFVITKIRSEEMDQQKVIVRREEADVRRFDADGNPGAPVTLPPARPIKVTIVPCLIRCARTRLSTDACQGIPSLYLENLSKPSFHTL